MAFVVKQIQQASAVTLMSTELNSLGSTGAAAASANLANLVGTSNTDGYIRGNLELAFGALGGSMNSNTGFMVYFLPTVDGTNFEDGSSSVTPARLPDVYLAARAVSTAQRIHRRCRVPVGTLGVLIVADTTGQALPASGNTLKLLLSTDELV